MKIAIYSGAVPSTTFIENLIKSVAYKHCVFLFGTQKGSVKYDSHLNIRTYTNPNNKYWRFFLFTIRFILLAVRYPNRLLIAIKEAKKETSNYSRRKRLIDIVPILLYLPDIFHVQWAKNINSWLFLKKHFNVKLVLSLRGAHINYSPIADSDLALIYFNSFPMVDRFHAVSSAISIEAQKYNAPFKRIEIINSIVSDYFFEKFTSSSKNWSEEIQILSVGRDHWIKGFRYAIDAIKLLVDKNVNVKYTIISTTPFTLELKHHVYDLDLNNYVELKSGVQQKDLVDVMSKSHCFLLSSVEEGIANVALESMAIGLPVISTNCGGMEEVVKHEETGLLVPSRDPKAICDAVIQMINFSHNEREKLIIEAHQLVSKNFNLKSNQKQFIDFYEKVVNN